MAHNRYLTDRTLKSLAPAAPGTRYEIGDTRLPCFRVRVSDTVDPSRPGKAAKITFVYYGRFPGIAHPTRRPIGLYGAMTLERARDVAGEWRSLIDKGIDPAALEKKRREDEARAAQRAQDRTFGAVAEKFFEWIEGKRVPERRAFEVRRTLEAYFVKPWKDRPIDSITLHDVQAVIESLVKRGLHAQAHNVFGDVRRLFRWAIPKYLEHSPCERLSPKQMIGERARRNRYLNEDEIIALWRATKRLRYPLDHLYRILALSALRFSEASEAQWSEIDVEARAWIVPADRMKKSGGEAKDHLVPLTDDMIAVLQSIPRVKGVRYVFATRDGGPILASSMTLPKRSLDRRMTRTLRALARRRGDDPDRIKLPHWVNHDLRRTARTNLSALKIPEEVREAVLAHARPGIKGTYDLYDYADEKRDALEKWSARLRAIVGNHLRRENTIREK
jgi:integrase